MLLKAPWVHCGLPRKSCHSNNKHILSTFNCFFFFLSVFGSFLIQTVRRHFVKKCKCHGVSGTCETSTCWRQIKPFKVIGDELKLRYERAEMVTVNISNSGALQLVTKSSKGSKRPSKGQIVFKTKSPDFCSRNQYSIGTAGRECNKTTTCESICCGRGYNIREITVREKCRCTFQWCCDVHCDECTKDVELSICRE